MSACNCYQSDVLLDVLWTGEKLWIRVKNRRRTNPTVSPFLSSNQLLVQCHRHQTRSALCILSTLCGIFIFLNFCLPFCLLPHHQIAFFVFPVVTLSSFSCVSALLFSFLSFKVFLKEVSESSPFYMWVHWDPERWSCSTQKEESWVLLHGSVLWDKSIFINAFLLNTLESMHQK